MGVISRTVDNIHRYFWVFTIAMIIFSVSIVYLFLEVLAMMVGVDTNRWHDRNYYQKQR